MKMAWKVSPPPTGSYRSFQFRSWPCLEYEDGQLAASIHCENSYSMPVVKAGNHGPLSVHVYDYSLGAQKRKCRVLVERFKSLDKAKAAAEAKLKRYPQFAANRRRGVPNEPARA